MPGLTRKVGTIFINLAVLTVSIMVCLLLGELAVRLVMPQQLILYNAKEILCPDSTLQHVHVRNANTVVNTGEGTVRFITDERGYRVNAGGNVADSSTRYSIVVLGDSFVDALQVENEQTIPGVLEATLRNRHGVPARVANAGVDGYGPNQYYLQAKKILADERYDLGFVCVFMANDVVARIDTTLTPARIGAAYAFRRPRELSWNEIVRAILYPINEYLDRRSHLFVLVRSRSKVLLARLGLTAYYFPDVFLTQEREAPRWSYTADLCRLIADEFSRHDIAVIFVLLPAEYQVYEDVFADYVRMFSIPTESVDLAQPNRLLTAALRKRGLSVVDMLEPMRQAVRTSDHYLYGKVDNHFNTDGYRFVGEYLAAVAKSRLLSEADSTSP